LQIEALSLINGLFLSAFHELSTIYRGPFGNYSHGSLYRYPDRCAHHGQAQIQWHDYFDGAVGNSLNVKLRKILDFPRFNGLFLKVT